MCCFHAFPDTYYTHLTRAVFSLPISIYIFCIIYAFFFFLERGGGSRKGKGGGGARLLLLFFFTFFSIFRSRFTLWGYFSHFLCSLLFFFRSRKKQAVVYLWFFLLLRSLFSLSFAVFIHPSRIPGKKKEKKKIIIRVKIRM